MRTHFSFARISCLGLVSCVFGMLVGCGEAVDEDEVVETSQFAYTVPAKGTATTLDVATYNLEWFGDTTSGPTDNTLQRQNVADVIAGTDLDIWGLQEVVSSTQFATLKSSLPGYAGFLSNDASVTSGSSYYTSTEQKLGILYKTSLATVQGAKLILTAKDYDFAGRPPMEVTLSVNINGTTAALIVIVLHAKASSDSASYQRRLNASTALKSYLDATYPTQKVLVLGDLNDDLDQSIAGGASPYANFLADPARYQFATKSISDASISTTVSGGATIDHILLTNEMGGTLLSDSPLAYRVNTYIPSYSTTTTDHFPVLSRFSWGAPAQLVLNEICANEPGSDLAGEFVEIVNIGGAAAALDGYTISDASAVRHTFAAGTSLAPGKAIVVFGGAAGIPAGLTNAMVSSTNGLGLANAGDAVYLKDSSGTIKDSVNYSASLASTDGVSMNRSPDAGATATYVLHTALSASARSPGNKASGSAF